MSLTQTRHDVLCVSAENRLREFCEGWFFGQRRSDPALWIVDSSVRFEVPVMDKKRPRPIGYLDAVVICQSWNKAADFARECAGAARVAGGQNASYGSPRPKGPTWRDVARERLGDSYQSFFEYVQQFGDEYNDWSKDSRYEIAACEFKTSIRDTGALLRQLNKYTAWADRHDVYFDLPDRGHCGLFVLMTPGPIGDQLKQIVLRQGWIAICAQPDLLES